MTIAGFDISLAGLALGVIIGMTYGILAVGLILIYRSNRIINFAHGEIGAFGAAMLALAVVRWHFPYWVAFPLALVASGGAGALVEVAVIRRLRRVPKLMSVVATLGAAQFVLLFSLAIASEVRSSITFPEPTGFPKFSIGALLVTPSYSAMLFCTPVLVGVLVWFLRRTRYGLAIRGSAANPDVARMIGVSAARMSTLTWVIAGAVSAYTAILIFPSRGLITGESLGPALLLRALAAAVVARMSSLPVALGAGIAVGIVEQALNLNFSSGGFVEMMLFVGIVAVLLVQARREGRDEEKGSWIAVQAWKPLPDNLRRVASIRNLGWIVSAVALAGAVVLAVFASNRTAIVFVSVMSFALVGLSVALISGMAGQLSLGQFALAGIGATVSYHVTSTQGNYLLGFAAAGVTAAVVSALIGIPAMRIRGLMLAVTTLGFALAAQAWLFQQPWMLGSGVSPGRPIIGSLKLDTGKKYYAFALIFLVVGVLLYRNIRRGGFGRALVALRDNEDGARAFTVPALRRKLQAFAFAGFLAGLGGAVFGHGLASISFQNFSPAASIDLVAMTVIGGIGILAGPLIGALYIIGVPAFVSLDTAGLAASRLGWLLLILYFPGGIAELIRPARDRVIGLLARRAGVTEEDAADQEAQVDTALREPPAARAPGDRVLLSVEKVTKQFGGIVAVDDVSLVVYEGETLGLIGPNGAGKTTLFELISGFTRVDDGSVVFDDHNVDSLGPEGRARLGLIRSFQDASLFSTLTVLDTVRLAMERDEPTRVWADMLGLRGSERRKDERARELVSLMGLDAFRNKQIAELSTGTRRITELAALIALQPKLLLLDEPSSGIAQRETEALGDVLARVKAHLNTTFVVIEHDMPLIMGLSHRVIAMEAGRVIAEGTPAEVRKDRKVIESYLGGDPTAIERSGVIRKPAKRKRRTPKPAARR